MKKHSAKTASRWLLALLLVTLLGGCGDGGDPDTGTVPAGTIPPVLEPLSTTRNFLLGLTPFANGSTPQAKDTAWTFVKQHSDLVALHFDTTDGLPWDILETGQLPADLPSAFRQPFDEAVTALNDGQTRKLYVALNPLNASRTGLSPQFGGGAFPLGNPSFDNPRLLTAFERYVDYILATFNPDYLAIGIEVNIYDVNERNSAIVDGGGFTAFSNFYKAVYDHIRLTRPSLPVFPTQQLEYILANINDWQSSMALYAGKIDRLGLSTYPSSQGKVPADLTIDYFASVLAFDSLPLVITETGYGSVPFASSNGTFTAPGSPELQRDYVRWLAATADSLPATLRPDFIVWFLPADAPSALPANPPPELADAAFYLTMGLADADLTPREAQRVWDQQLTRPYVALR